VWSAGSYPAFREARGAGRLVTEEKLDLCRASVKLIAHRVSGHGKKGGCRTGTKSGEHTRLPLLLTGSERMGDCSARSRVGWQTSSKDSWAVLQLGSMVVPDVPAWG